MSTTTTMTTETSHYQKGEHYTELSQPIKHTSPVIVFFSFLDGKSYDWAVNHEVVNTIRKHVPAGTIVDRYHTPLHDPQSFADELTHAWAVAKDMQIDDKVVGPLYQAIQVDKTAVDMQGVKQVFEKAGGIPPLRFDREYSKLSVKKEAEHMRELPQELNIQKIPAIVVGGKYLLRPEAFGQDFHAHKVADVIKELLDLKA